MRCVIKNKSMAKHPLACIIRIQNVDDTRPTFQVFGHTFTYEQVRPRYRGRSLVYLCDSSAAKLRNVNKQQTLIFYQRKLNGRLRLICSIRLQSYAFFLIYSNLSKSFLLIHSAYWRKFHFLMLKNA